MTKEDKIKYNSFYGKNVTDKIQKEKDLKFLKGFVAIKLSDILKKYNIDSSNFYHNKISKEKVYLVKNEVDKEIIRLYYENKN